jgi:hypothetical protein
MVVLPPMVVEVARRCRRWCGSREAATADGGGRRCRRRWSWTSCFRRAWSTWWCCRWCDARAAAEGGGRVVPPPMVVDEVKALPMVVDVGAAADGRGRRGAAAGGGGWSCRHRRGCTPWCHHRRSWLSRGSAERVDVVVPLPMVVDVVVPPPPMVVDVVLPPPIVDAVGPPMTVVDVVQRRRRSSCSSSYVVPSSRPNRRCRSFPRRAVCRRYRQPPASAPRSGAPLLDSRQHAAGWRFSTASSRSATQQLENGVTRCPRAMRYNAPPASRHTVVAQRPSPGDHPGTTAGRRPARIT